MPVTILYNQTHLVHSSVLSQDVEFLADVSFFHVPYGYLVPKMNMPLTVMKMFESVSDVNSAQGSYPHINDIVPYGRHDAILVDATGLNYVVHTQIDNSMYLSIGKLPINTSLTWNVFSTGVLVADIAMSRAIQGIDDPLEAVDKLNNHLDTKIVHPIVKNVDELAKLHNEKMNAFDRKHTMLRSHHYLLK